MAKKGKSILESEGKSFITVDTYVAALYDKDSSGLCVKYWKKLIPPEDFADFQENEKFCSFEDMLDYIERWTPYTLFAIIPYSTNSYNKIKLIYTQK